MTRIIYGINPVMEALAVGAERIERILISQGRSDKAASGILKAASRARIHCSRVNKDELNALAEGGVHQGGSWPSCAQSFPTSLLTRS